MLFRILSIGPCVIGCLFRAFKVAQLVSALTPIGDPKSSSQVSEFPFSLNRLKRICYSRRIGFEEIALDQNEFKKLLESRFLGDSEEAEKFIGLYKQYLEASFEMKRYLKFVVTPEIGDKITSELNEAQMSLTKHVITPIQVKFPGVKHFGKNK